jgi:hypothetical protein
VGRTVHPWPVGLEEDLHRAKVQAPPPSTPFAAVVPRCPGTADAAASPTCSSWPDMDDHEFVFLVELDVLDDGVLDAQQGAP